MRKRIGLALLSLSMMASSTSGFAADTPSPNSPKPTSSAKTAKPVLTQVQIEAMVAARAAFALAKSNAQNGFDRALADAQAIRDQAIASAGKDEKSIQIAKKNYHDSYKIIMRAYKSDVNAAKSVLKNALAAVRASQKS
jgi:hypothetical protein